MNISFTTIFTILLYFAVVFAIGLWTKRKETRQEFLIGNRNVGLLATTASMVAVIGGIVIVGQAAFAYEVGFAAMWFWAGFALGILVLGKLAHKIKHIADEQKFLTISDYLFTRFGYKNGILAASILFLSFFALLTGQFIAGASLFGPLLNIPYPIAVLILGGSTLLYLIVGGFKAVVKTDILQFIIMFIVFVLIVTQIDQGTLKPEQYALTAIDPTLIVAFVIVGIFAVLAGADFWQRIFAARSIKIVKKATYLTAGIFIVFGAALSVVGIAAKNSFPLIESNEALYYGMFELLPAPLLGVAIIIILAAIMSTIDTELFYLSSSIAKDYYYRKKEIPDEQLTQIIKRAVVVLAIISMAIAIFISDILTVLFGVVSLMLSVSPALLASLLWKKVKKNAVFLSLIGGALAFLGITVTGNLSPDNAVITLPAAIIFLIIGQILFKNKSRNSYETPGGQNDSEKNF